jgi:hypothetical protein
MSDQGQELIPTPETMTSRWPSGRQAITLFISGLILGAGGCAAFLSVVSTDSSGVLSFIFGAAFFVGLFLVLAAFVECVVIVVRGLTGKS